MAKQRHEQQPAPKDTNLTGNLKLGGCFIRTSMPEPAGAMVMLRFALPGESEDTIIQAVGQVCWLRDEKDGAAGMGIRFVEVNDADFALLKGYIGGQLEADRVEVVAA